jgi:hypothetical protein
MRSGGYSIRPRISPLEITAAIAGRIAIDKRDRLAAYKAAVSRLSK